VSRPSISSEDRALVVSHQFAVRASNAGPPAHPASVRAASAGIQNFRMIDVLQPTRR
jgi:hypothetical protein